jgi:hypothetical protein
MNHQQINEAVRQSLNLSPVRADRQFESSRKRPTPEVVPGAAVAEAVIRIALEGGR